MCGVLLYGLMVLVIYLLTGDAHTVFVVLGLSVFCWFVVAFNEWYQRHRGDFF